MGDSKKHVRSRFAVYHHWRLKKFEHLINMLDGNKGLMSGRRGGKGAEYTLSKDASLSDLVNQLKDPRRHQGLSIVRNAVSIRLTGVKAKDIRNFDAFYPELPPQNDQPRCDFFMSTTKFGSKIPITNLNLDIGEIKAHEEALLDRSHPTNEIVKLSTPVKWSQYLTEQDMVEMVNSFNELEFEGRDQNVLSLGLESIPQVVFKIASKLDTGKLQEIALMSAVSFMLAVLEEDKISTKLLTGKNKIEIYRHQIWFIK